MKWLWGKLCVSLCLGLLVGCGQMLARIRLLPLNFLRNH